MKKSLIAAVAVALLVLLGVGYSLNQNDSTNSDDSSQTQTTEETSQQPEENISFSEEGKTVTYNGVEGITALATLESLTDVKTEDSDFGEFVVSINGVAADSTKEYWSFYVNDAYADEGAGTYEAKAGDVFTWKLESLQ